MTPQLYFAQPFEILESLRNDQLKALVTQPFHGSEGSAKFRQFDASLALEQF